MMTTMLITRTNIAADVDVYKRQGLDYGDSVSVPSVVGMTKNDAITTLGKWTDIKVTEQQSSDVASGEVISQNPVADETADPDQPIEIVVSSGNAVSYTHLDVYKRQPQNQL